MASLQNLAPNNTMSHFLNSNSAKIYNSSSGDTLSDLSAGPIVYPREITIFAAVCCITFVIVGLTGNFITVLALCFCRKLRRHATTAFIISLSIADLLFCAFNLPLTASRYIQEAWVLGNTLCVLFPFLFYGNVGVSLTSLTAITINRYILIAHHQWYDRIYTPVNISLMIAAIWAFSFAILLPPLTNTWGTFGYKMETFSCTILHNQGKSPKKFLFLVGFLLPCVVILLSYSCIFYKVRKSRHKLASHSWNTPNGKHTNGEVNSKFVMSKRWSDDMRLTRLMIIIFFSFLLCYLPLTIANVCLDDSSYPAFHVLSSVLAYASSCINPFLYAVLNNQYRKAYSRLICRTFRRFGKSTEATLPASSGSCSGKTLTSDACQYTASFQKLQTNLGSTSDDNADS